MKKSNNQIRCEAIVREAFIKGFVNQISRNDLRNSIQSSLYLIDERSIDKWEKALKTFSLIIESEPKLGRRFYCWNYPKLEAMSIHIQTDLKEVEQ